MSAEQSRSPWPLIAEKDPELARWLSKTIENLLPVVLAAVTGEFPGKSRRGKKTRSGQGRNSNHQA